MSSVSGTPTKTQRSDVSDPIVLVSPAPPGANPIAKLRAELAGMRDRRGVPLFWLPQLRREVLLGALDLLDCVTHYREIASRQAPHEVAMLAQDLFCMRAAEADCAGGAGAL
jgi:hypothetical protein